MSRAAQASRPHYHLVVVSVTRTEFQTVIVETPPTPEKDRRTDDIEGHAGDVVWKGIEAQHGTREAQSREVRARYSRQLNQRELIEEMRRSPTFVFTPKRRLP